MTTTWIEIPENMLALVAQNYERTVPSLLEDVATLRNWMKTQPHLPEILDDKRLQNFLTLNKCSVEKAKKRIDMYYTLRSKIPEIFDNLSPECDAIKKINKVVNWVLLPKTTKEMYRVWVMKFSDKNMVNDIISFHLVSQILALQEVRFQEDIMFGEVIIADLDGATLQFMTKFTPPVMTKMVAVYEKILSFPMKRLYLINSPAFIGTLLAVLKSVLKPKLFERVKVCQDTSILTESLPRECIPRDYGGDEKSVEELFEVSKRKMKEYESRFDELQRMKVDESLRPEELKNDEVLGFHGNFKKLDVD